MNLQTTLNIIRAAKPCADGWANLLKSIPADIDHDAPIAFLHILNTNGLSDALWALRCVLPSQEKERDREARLFACDCSENVLHIFEAKYPDDKRPRESIEVARRFAHGNATTEELSAESAAASAAERAACAAARAAAWAAAAAADAAAAAARDAAWAAAWAAADAAADAAWAAARDKQKAQFITRFCTQEASQ